MSKKKLRLFIRVLLLIIAAGSCIYGICMGETQTVNKKATNICLECIGIG